MLSVNPPPPNPKLGYEGQGTRSLGKETNMEAKNNHLYGGSMSCPPKAP